MSKQILRVVLVGLLALIVALPAVAQDATEEAGGEPSAPPAMQMPPPPEGAEVVAQGLNYPRQLTIARDGTIYVAEGGVGGDIVVHMAGGEGEADTDANYGLTSQITTIADGSQSVLLGGLPSISAGGEGGGATDVAVSDDGLWVAISGSGPLGIPGFLGSSNVLRFDGEAGILLNAVDLYTYEQSNNVDGNALDSNVTDVEIGPDGTVYIVDTGANALYTWSADGGLEVLTIWPDNPVPTAVVVGPDGNLYVSFLGTGIAPGAGMVQVLSPDGEIVDTYSGYNALTDLAVTEDGTIYAVSIFAGFGDQGPLPGQLLRVTADGGEVVTDGLMMPYGIAIDGDGSLLVTVGTAFVPPGSGMVLRLPAA
jgi:hypothetical protein